MALCHDFCKPIENGAKIEYAPDHFPPSYTAPSEAEYNAAGFFRCAITPPEPAEGYTVASTRYEVQSGKVVAVYEYAPIPAPIRVFDIARVIYWSDKHDIFVRLKELCGESITLQMVALGDIREDNEDLIELLPALEAEFGAETVAACLAYAAGEDEALVVPGGAD